MTFSISSDVLARCIAAIHDLRAGDAADEELSLPGANGAELFVAPKPASLVAHVTERALLANLPSKPLDVTLVARSGRLRSEYAAFVAREAAHTNASLAFIGDLSPSSFVAFLGLLDGLRDVGADPSAALYRGIDDAWLARCEGHLLPELLSPTLVNGVATSRTLLTQMTEIERATLQTLEHAGLDVAALVGPRCAALVRGGCTIDLRSASDPAKYQGDFSARLLVHLFPTNDLQLAPLDQKRRDYQDLLDGYTALLEAGARDDAIAAIEKAEILWTEICASASPSDPEVGAGFMHAVLAFSAAAGAGDAIEAKRLFGTMIAEYQSAVPPEHRIWERA